MPINNPKQPEVTEEDEKVWLNIIACSVTDPKRSHRMLARHRIATRERVLEEAARVAVKLADNHSYKGISWMSGCLDVAAAIRAMKEEPK